MLKDIASVDGRIVPAAEARIPVDDIAFTYGYGVYENVALRKGALLFAERHAARLARSAGIIGMPAPPDVLARLREFAREMDEDCNVKMLLVDSRLYIFASRPRYLPAKAYRDGVSVVTVEAERPFPQAKTLSMLTSYLAYRKAREAGAYDALLVDSDGNVPEGTRTNLFFTDGKTVFTPPVEDVLPGVARELVIGLLGEEGIPFEERRLSAAELGSHAGYFLTSTSAKVLPVSAFDGRKCGIPDIVEKIRRGYEGLLSAWAEPPSRGTDR